MHFSDQVSIGSITLTRSALIMLIAGLILSLVIALTVPFGIFIGLFVFLGVCVGAYNVNCAVVGKCYNWAAFLTIFYVIYVILNVAVLFMKKTNPNLLVKLVKSKK